MDAGQLNQRIVFKQRVATRISGKESVTYVPVRPASAKWNPIRGREFATFQAAQSEIEGHFTTYYGADVRADWRVEWRGNDYEIVGPPIEIDGGKTWMEVYVRTAQT